MTKLGYILAAIGATFSLITFFLPFVSVYYCYPLGFCGDADATTIANFEPLLWLEVGLLILVIILSIGNLLWRRPFTIRWASFLALAVLVLGIFSLLLYIGEVSSYIENALPKCLLGFCIQAASNYDVGFWLFLLWTVFIIVGAIVALVSNYLHPRTENRRDQPLSAWEDFLF